MNRMILCIATCLAAAAAFPFHCGGASQDGKISITIKASLPDGSGSPDTNLPAGATQRLKLDWHGGETLYLFAVRHDGDGVRYRRFPLKNHPSEPKGLFKGELDFSGSGLDAGDIRAAILTSRPDDADLSIVTREKTDFLTFKADRGTKCFIGDIPPEYLSPCAIIEKGLLKSDRNGGYLIENLKLSASQPLIVFNIFDSSEESSKATVSSIVFRGEAITGTGAVNLKNGNVSTLAGTKKKPVTIVGRTYKAGTTAKLSFHNTGRVPSSSDGGIRIPVPIKPPVRYNDRVELWYVKVILSDGRQVIKYFDDPVITAPSAGQKRFFLPGLAYNIDIDLSFSAPGTRHAEKVYSTDGGRLWGPDLPADRFSSLARSRSAKKLTKAELLKIRAAIEDHGARKGVDLDLSDCRYATDTFPNVFSGTPDKAFNGLRSIKLPANIRVIGKDAFAWCGNLSDAGTGSRTYSVGEGAFSHTKVQYPAPAPKAARTFRPLSGHGRTLTLASGGKTPYTIIYDIDDKTNTELFRHTLDSLTGARFLMCEASDNNQSDCEVIVGRQESRPECRHALEGIANGYAIKVYGSKVIIAGTDAGWTSLALEVFNDRVLRNTSLLSSGRLAIPADFSVSHSEDLPELFPRFVEEGRKFTLRTEFFCHIPPQGDFKVPQGAVSDGKHIYVAFRNVADKVNVNIVKYSINPFRFIAESGPVRAEHGNDMAYDPYNNRLIVIHSPSRDPDRVSVIDSGTLKDLGCITMPAAGSQITYDSPRHRYCFQSGKKVMILDDDFRVMRSFMRTDYTGYIPQGVGNDSCFLYFPMWVKPSTNLLAIYSWEGKHIGNFDIPAPAADRGTYFESETLFYTGGKYYIQFYRGRKRGSTIYTVTPVLDYKF